MRNALAPATSMSHLVSNFTPHPDDCDECVFIVRAVARLGAAMFGEEWTGRERTTIIPEPLPDALDPRLAASLLTDDGEDGTGQAQWLSPPSSAFLLRADSLLQRWHPSLERRSGLRLMANLLKPLTFTYDEWQLAQAAAERERADALAARRRLYLIHKKIKQLCLRGDLVTKLRQVAGGEYSAPLPPAWWRTEVHYPRFETGKMHPDHPFDPYAPEHEQRWLFMTTESLSNVERRLKQADAQGSDSSEPTRPYVSEFMQCMLRTSAALGITADNMPKKAVVEAEIPKHWRGDRDLSAREKEYMASFIRSEASRDRKKR